VPFVISFQRERLTAKKFFEQFVVLFRGGFLEAFMAFVELLAQILWHVGLGRRTKVQDLRENSLPGDRQFERNAVLSKRTADLLHATEKVAVLLVELVDEYEAWFLHFIQHFPDAARADFDAAHAVDDDNGCVGGADRGQRVAKKVGKTRRVEQGDRVACHWQWKDLA